jgi:hypothetical protein
MNAKKRQENKKTDNSRNRNETQVKVLILSNFYKKTFYLYTLGTRFVITQGTS